MAKQPRGSHFIISAGFTSTGAPAYLKADGTWSEDLQDAVALKSPEERDERLAAALKQERVVCDPYAVAVEVAGDKIDPLTARENIRAQGPTVPYRRPDPPAR
jgi:hypothetical protein